MLEIRENSASHTWTQQSVKSAGGSVPPPSRPDDPNGIWDKTERRRRGEIFRSPPLPCSRTQNSNRLHCNKNGKQSYLMKNPQSFNAQQRDDSEKEKGESNLTNPVKRHSYKSLKEREENKIKTNQATNHIPKSNHTTLNNQQILNNTTRKLQAAKRKKALEVLPI